MRWASICGTAVCSVLFIAASCSAQQYDYEVSMTWRSAQMDFQPRAGSGRFSRPYQGRGYALAGFQLDTYDRDRYGNRQTIGVRFAAVPGYDGYGMRGRHGPLFGVRGRAAWHVYAPDHVLWGTGTSDPITATCGLRLAGTLSIELLHPDSEAALDEWYGELDPRLWYDVTLASVYNEDDEDYDVTAVVQDADGAEVYSFTGKAADQRTFARVTVERGPLATIDYRVSGGTAVPIERTRDIEPADFCRIDSGFEVTDTGSSQTVSIRPKITSAVFSASHGRAPVRDSNGQYHNTGLVSCVDMVQEIVSLAWRSPWSDQTFSDLAFGGWEVGNGDGYLGEEYPGQSEVSSRGGALHLWSNGYDESYGGQGPTLGLQFHRVMALF